MPWQWQGRGSNETQRHTAADAAVAHAWPGYEAEYLKRRLLSERGKYNPVNKDVPGEIKDVLNNLVYLNKVSEDYKQEADECLEQEFRDWLSGAHVDNHKPSIYKNAPDKPRRFHVIDDGKHKLGTDMRDWQPTWWGTRQLTHLPGVREYLRNDYLEKKQHELDMNMLAQYGPYDLKSAWQYFKHWVKARPVSTGMQMSATQPVGIRSDVRSRPPNDPPNDDDESFESFGGGETFGVDEGVTSGFERLRRNAAAQRARDDLNMRVDSYRQAQETRDSQRAFLELRDNAAFTPAQELDVAAGTPLPPPDDVDERDLVEAAAESLAETPNATEDAP